METYKSKEIRTKWVFKSLLKAAVYGASIVFLGNLFHAYAAAMLKIWVSSLGMYKRILFFEDLSWWEGW